MPIDWSDRSVGVDGWSMSMPDDQGYASHVSPSGDSYYGDGTPWKRGANWQDFQKEGLWDDLLNPNSKLYQMAQGNQRAGQPMMASGNTDIDMRSLMGLGGLQTGDTWNAMQQATNTDWSKRPDFVNAVGGQLDVANNQNKPGLGDKIEGGLLPALAALFTGGIGAAGGFGAGVAGSAAGTGAVAGGVGGGMGGLQNGSNLGDVLRGAGIGAAGGAAAGGLSDMLSPQQLPDFTSAGDQMLGEGMVGGGGDAVVSASPVSAGAGAVQGTPLPPLPDGSGSAAGGGTGGGPPGGDLQSMVNNFPGYGDAGLPNMGGGTGTPSAASGGLTMPNFDNLLNAVNSWMTPAAGATAGASVLSSGNDFGTEPNQVPQDQDLGMPDAPGGGASGGGTGGTPGLDQVMKDLGFGGGGAGGTGIFGQKGAYQFPYGDVLGALTGMWSANKQMDTLKEMQQKAIDSDLWRGQQGKYFDPLYQAATQGIGNTPYGQSIAQSSMRQDAAKGYNMSGNMLNDVAKTLNSGTTDYMRATTPLATGRAGPADAIANLGQGIAGAQGGFGNAVGFGLGSIFQGGQSNQPGAQQNAGLEDLFKNMMGGGGGTGTIKI